MFSNVEDPEIEIKFHLDDRDEKHLMVRLGRSRTLAKLLNIIKPPEMGRLTGMLCIKNDLTTFRDIAIFNGEPIDVGHDNQFNNQKPIESEPKCFIKPRA